MRMYGYWEPQIYWVSQEQHHVNYIKGIATQITRTKDGRLLVRGEDTTMGRPMEVPMDMVVLSVGMEPSPGTIEMAGVFGLALNKYRFIDTLGGALDTVTTSVPGIFACGAATGPADLEDSVSSAAAAAMKAIGVVRRAALAGST
ncbi:MAG: FAD-dependent oxidoreductase, partial [Planctomycetes bacterium]|nr:FAD-dependent oxidoreductase [Planctomycetota bacterium]